MLLNERNIDFLLYEFMDTEALLKRPRYSEHSREVFDATIATARNIAEKYLAPHYQKADANEPSFDGESVHVLAETKAAWDAISDAGFLKAHCDVDQGGLQLPEVVLRSSMAYFNAANGPTTAYAFLTLGVINLIRTFGSAQQQARFLGALMDGEFAGTMALTEPGQGSALADIKTRAEPQADGSYRIFGQKMFISGAEQNLSKNIIHMTLAKAKGAAPGVKGISLFIVPKFLVADDGSLAERNDVALAGLLHKMGNRNTTSTVLNFGEKNGAVGYLIGGLGQGLACMFQMMNEARIGIGLNAASIAARAYMHALEYARTRPQGRLSSNKDPRSPQVMLIEHADIRRMLLAQKAYSEGALALCLYASALFEDERTHPDEAQRARASALLNLLTPVVKSWPAKYGCVSCELAIQVLGGSGYTREYPVEQLYRDQRLNPIHEGAEGIHALDLLGRRLRGNNGAGLLALREEIAATLADAKAIESLAGLAGQLEHHFALLMDAITELVAVVDSDVDRGLANASLFLDVFGRVVVSWLWVKQAICAAHGLGLPSAHEAETDFYHGKLHAARYYLEWELPQIVPSIALLRSVNAIPYEMRDEWF